MPRVNFLIVFALCVLFAPVAYAQDEGPDYRIAPISGQPAVDDDNLNLLFGVTNLGSAATIEATVYLIMTDSGDQLGLQTIKPPPP